MIKLIAQILTISGSALTGMYFVSTMAMENVVMKFEKKQDTKYHLRELKHQNRNDTLINRVNETLRLSQNAFSLDEYGQVVQEIVNDSERSLKRFVKSENKKQEDQFDVFYMMDENDSTFKLLTYKGSDGKNIIVRKIPINTNEFNKINN